MLTKVNEELWLDLERVIRVARDGQEVKYTIDFKERMVTYCVDEIVGQQLINALNLQEIARISEVDKFILEQITPKNGDSA